MVAAFAYGSHRAQTLDGRALREMIAAPGSDAERTASILRPLGNLPAMLATLAVACGVGLARGRRREALAALVVVAGANLTTQMLKVLFSHPRVRAALGDAHLAWDGFPSGHVTAAWGFAALAGLRQLGAGASPAPPELSRPAAISVK